MRAGLGPEPEPKRRMTNDTDAFVDTIAGRGSMWINWPRNCRLQPRRMSCVYRAGFYWRDHRSLACRRASFAEAFFLEHRRRKLSNHLVDHRVGIVCGGDQLDHRKRPQVVVRGQYSSTNRNEEIDDVTYTCLSMNKTDLKRPGAAVLMGPLRPIKGQCVWRT